jgi:hypothetical protein
MMDDGGGVNIVTIENPNSPRNPENDPVENKRNTVVVVVAQITERYVY